jgi:glycogen debranching enzyme
MRSRRSRPQRASTVTSSANAPDGDGLLSIITRFESGLDYSPAYGDGRGNPFAVYFPPRLDELRNRLAGFDLRRIFAAGRQLEDVLFNTVYSDGLRALSRLASQAHDAELAAWADGAASRVTQALLERCWDERAGLFFNLSGRAETAVRTRTIVSFLPLLLPDLPRDVAAKLVERLLDERTFWTRYPVASVALDEPSFRRDNRVWRIRFIWRGPCSMNTNWFVARGLRRHGYDAEADELAERSRALVERGGFNEFFDPVDGRPVGAPDFGWATLAVDL